MFACSVASVVVPPCGRPVAARLSPRGMKWTNSAASETWMMLTFNLLLLLLLLRQVGATPLADDVSEPTTCLHWNNYREGEESVVAGQVGWLSCPIDASPTDKASRTFVWYRLFQGQEMALPITPSGRLSKEEERLWLQPATDTDAGLYVCKLWTSCIKASVWLTVLASNHSQCLSPRSPPFRQVPFQTDAVLDCPDLAIAAEVADGEPSVTWFHMALNREKCFSIPKSSSDPELRHSRLYIHVMLDFFQGSFFCRVSYRRMGQELHFTRSLDIRGVYPIEVSGMPTILLLAPDDRFPIRRNAEVRLVCAALFHSHIPYASLWWQVDGIALDQLADHDRFLTLNRSMPEKYGEEKKEIVLVIKNFLPTDLQREFNCSAKNEKGLTTRRVHLTEEARLPWVELCCGLGATLLLALLLFLMYHFFWLELLLLYRSWFGTDEQLFDNKDYDVYISYSRNSEDEDFVLSTLRSVLETQLGYTVCIFDRDSLPGGTITDETLSFVARSRRLLVVVSPGYASRGSQALLELKAGLDSMARGGHLRVILVQYRPVRGQGWVKELRRARMALALVHWRGDQSQQLTSRFWKKLRVELPLRERSSQKEAGLMRLLHPDGASYQRKATLPGGLRSSASTSAPT